MYVSAFTDFITLFYLFLHRWRKRNTICDLQKNDGLQIPIQLQFSVNSLKTNLLASDNVLETQQESDSASSGSKLDCSGVVDHTGSDDAGTHVRLFHCLQPDSPSTSVHVASG